MLTQEDWIGRRMLADRFRDRRVFICGDAAHIWVPFAGYGMNAGIADAMNLSWMLAGVLQGWAAPGILDAHEAERWPITEQVSQYAMGTALSLARARPRCRDDIETDADARARASGAPMHELNMPQFCCGGLNFGYFYDRSPIIAYDGEAAPPYTMYDFTPSTVPGCRTPHMWLNDGRSLYDAMGLVSRCCVSIRSVAVDTLADAAAKRGVPFAVLDVDDERTLPPQTRAVAPGPARRVAWKRVAEITGVGRSHTRRYLIRPRQQAGEANVIQLWPHLLLEQRQARAVSS